MKRNVFVFSALTVAVLMFSSCDFLRTVAGRPTSGELELKRERIAEKTRLKKQALEQAELRERAVRDSIYVQKEIDSVGIKFNSASRIISSTQEPLKARYYVVVGSFQDWTNAEKQLLAAESAGFEGDIVRYKSGASAVIICPSNDLVSLYSEYKKARDCGFCPDDAWFLINE